MRPGSDGILEIKVGERTIEVKREYITNFVFEVEMAQEFIGRIVAHREEMHDPSNVSPADLKIALDPKVANIGFVPVGNTTEDR
ncbi:MAG: hypothetical protein C4524_01000 [Candidatus Zixiibacteriota bacterium]|nr:MAG: hypothetical protein C4524_01000 [candidate division Zixibacteria bacterium]